MGSVFDGAASAGVSAAGSVLGSVFGNLFNSNQAAKSRKWATREREASQFYQTSERQASQAFQTSERQDQNAWSEQQYLKYNSPQAIAQQLRAAGLNPSVMMSGTNGSAMGASSGSTGGAPSGSSPGFGSVPPPYMSTSSFTSAFSDIANAVKSIGEAKKLGIETKYLEDEIVERLKSTKAGRIAQEVQTKMDMTKLKYLDKREQAEIEKLFQDIANGQASYEQTHEAIEIMRKQGVLLDKDAKSYDIRLASELNKIDSEAALNKATASKVPSEISLNKASTGKLYEEARKLGYDADQIRDLKDVVFETALSALKSGRLKNAQDFSEAVIKNVESTLMRKFGKREIPDG
ncbi:MAG: hypothetical protein HDS75_06075, partial [Bacteroidales bacterium]|nr:hypothetical protein [Bacteroidales bacterium]